MSTAQNPPSRPNEQHSTRTPREVLQYYKLLAEDLKKINIQDDGGPPSDSIGKTVEGRKQLCEDYEIPYQDKGDLAYYFVNYEDPKEPGAESDNFTLFIQQQATLFKQTLVGDENGDDRGVQVPDDPGRSEWQQTSFYKFLVDMSEPPNNTDDPQNPLAEEFHKTFPGGNPDDQKKFWDRNMSTNGFGEQHAIETLLADRDDTALGEAMADLLFTLRSVAFWC